MAVAHGVRLSGDGDLHSAAEACPFVRVGHIHPCARWARTLQTGSRTTAHVLRLLLVTLSSCDIAVMICAGANGFCTSVLFGTPCAAQSST